MNRLDKVRKYIDQVLFSMPDGIENRYKCFMHLYGVSQTCTMLAMKRKENIELAAIAGMLHDIYSCKALESQDHAHKGASMARKILDSMNIFADDEIDAVCGAIYNHSSKDTEHSPFDEVLIDADVLQHCLYDPTHVAPHERARFEKLKIEFGID